MEPMDLDSDGDSSFRWSHQRYSTGLQSPLPANNTRSGSDVSDMDIDAHSPMHKPNDLKSSASWDCISNVLSSVLSIKQGCDSDTNDFAEQSQETKPTTFGNIELPALHISNMTNEHTNPRDPTLTNVQGAAALKNGIKKPGYGLPEEDPLFAHFPQSHSKTSDENVSFRRRPILQSLDRKPVLPNNISIRPLVKKLSDINSQELSESGSRRFCSCKQFFLLFFVCIIFGLVAYVIYLQKQICRSDNFFNKKVLEIDLEANVFGQHIATKIIPDKIDEYMHRFHTNHDLSLSAFEYELQKAPLCKPLVLSFHGWTGVGKNYISKIISDSFKHSKVSHFIMPFHFPHRTYESLYRDQIEQWIVGNTTSCVVNVVVVDEMDKAFPNVVEGIANAITSLTQPCSLATPTLILLLSNSHAVDINRAFLKFLSTSTDKKREEFSLEDLGSIFYDNSEWWYSYLFDKKLLDAFVPFLPLEKTHVIQCIRRDLVAKRFSTDSQSIDKILKELSFSMFGNLELSSTGCKRVADKVDYIMLDKP
ncbi:unnamed protein product [Lymnaea stagnalis]|uniref:Torsin-1A C-terminal domain-containing protein n=1 Tax=Lymnaea stagnalis TaxID=6523 RepID=A0AAV2HSS6_LYMST